MVDCNNHQPPKDEMTAFNMAVATLMRLDETLKEIKKIGYIIAAGQDEEGEMIDKASFLNIKISLARSYFLFADPILPQDKRDGLQEELDKLKVPIKQIVSNSPDRPGKFNIIYYDEKLDRDIDKFIIKINHILKNYFMPPKNDPRFAMMQG
jgi:hypothetical protein